MESTGLTRRQALKVGAATFVGYAAGVDKALAQAIKTDTDGIVAGDHVVKIGDYSMPVYEARPASSTNAPIVIAISEVWGVHEWVKDVTRRFAKAGYCCVAPELFQREGGVAQLTDIQAILKIVFAVPRKQLLGDVAAAADWAKMRPGVRADRIGVTGWCWGGGGGAPGGGDQPGHQGRSLVVRSHGPSLRRYTEPGDRIRRGQGHQGAVPGLYGEADTNPTPADAQKFVEMLKPHNPTAEAVVFPGAGHAFFAEIRPSYNAAAAAEGWKRCLAHFDKHLKA